MEQGEYLAEIRRIQDRTRLQVKDLATSIMTRPWRLGKTATEIAEVYAASVVAIRSLTPPAEDADGLEQHFLGPLEAQANAVRDWAGKVRADFRRLRLRKAIRELGALGVLAGQTNPEDLAWCQSYGLGGAPSA